MPPETSRCGRCPRRGADELPRAAWLFGALGTMLACSAAPGEGRSLGTDLGTFSVEAARATNECGADAVGNPRRFDFDVELASDPGELRWGGTPGTLDANLGFEIEASVRVELRAARGEDPGCAIVREDLIFGDLVADEAGTVTSLTGEMHFAFAAARESTCTLEEQSDAALPRLPCGMSYALSGRRTRAPAP